MRVMQAAHHSFARGGHGLGLVLSGAMWLGVPPAGAAPAPAPPVSATGTWREHTVQFEFVGYYAVYSCDGLAEKLRVLLTVAGARSDIRVKETCRIADRPAGGAAARVTFHSLELTTERAPGSVPAVWRPVALRDRRPFEIRSTDCELVDQFRDKLLPLFAVRKLQDHTRCDPAEDTPGSLRLEFEVLAAAPAT